MTILDEIFQHKRVEIEERKQIKPLHKVRAQAEQAAPAQDFIAAIRNREFPALIAEVKHASPSRGILVPNFDPLRLARIYQEHGAAAISVLTDQRYFLGSLEDLRQIAGMELENGKRLPLLRKDFLCDLYQVYEARAAGADAVLLITAYLETNLLKDLHALALELGMAPLVEIHNQEEIQRALECNPILMGINNRDLRTFQVRLETTLELQPHIPNSICLISESGIHTAQDIYWLQLAGVDGILVGEALVTAADIRAKVRELSGLPLIEAD